MKLLTLFNGGHPFRNDDLDFVKSSTQEICKMLAGALMPSTAFFILHGCKVTYTGLFATAITEGAVYINGEILYIPAQSFAILGPLGIKPRNTNTGTVLYKNGTARVVQEVRIGTIIDTDIEPGVDFYSLRNIREKFTQTFTAPNQSFTGYPVTITRVLDQVTVDGIPTYAAAFSPANHTLFTIGNGLAPKREIRVPAIELLVAGSTQSARIITVKTNGDFVIDGINGSVGPLDTQILFPPITYSIF